MKLIIIKIVTLIIIRLSLIIDTFKNFNGGIAGSLIVTDNCTDICSIIMNRHSGKGIYVITGYNIAVACIFNPETVGLVGKSHGDKLGIMPFSRHNVIFETALGCIIAEHLAIAAGKRSVLFPSCGKPDLGAGGLRGG